MPGADRPGEFDLIARYFRPLAATAEAFGLADDAAILPAWPGEDVVVTKDMLVAGVHFFPEDAAASVARKALRVNLSDLAAKGATPFAYLLGLALGDGWSEAWVAGFADGLAGDQQRYEVTLLGGDTVATPGPTTISITAFGHLPAGTMVHRAGARTGDVVVVSGTIGDAALGLRVRREPQWGEGRDIAHLLDRYLHPQPRVALAPLVRRYATAAMDVSDGLVGDLAHLCRASGVTAKLGALAVPLSPAATALLEAYPDAIVTILTGGDDYEILATVPPDRLPTFVAEAAAIGEAISPIGHILVGQGPPTVRDGEGRTMDFGGRTSWVHR